eukprot:6472759-Amphidinium_carterae.1
MQSVRVQVARQISVRFAALVGKGKIRAPLQLLTWMLSCVVRTAHCPIAHNTHAGIVPIAVALLDCVERTI